MIKTLQLIIIIISTFSLSMANSIEEFSNEKFMEKYVETLKKADTKAYTELLLSESEMKEIIQSSNEKYANCITDAETSYNPMKTLSNFDKISNPLKTVQSYKILYTKPIDGCGIIKGMKMSVELINENGATSSRSLFFIKYKDSYKILFDITNGEN